MAEKQQTVWFFPGQGSQYKGMGGEELFNAFPQLVNQADEILGYSIADLCLRDPEGKLGQTEFSQPALFVVNALMFNKEKGSGVLPDYLAGHSLGEYNTLYAAGCFDFQTGLRLVKRRGELMGQAKNGGMAAVIGLPEEKVVGLLNDSGCRNLDIANVNSSKQVVVSGDIDDIHRLKKYCSENQSRDTQ
ncbi:MAG: ACP S-malonyltransferase, partial [Pseudomonadota bacterium]